MASIFQDDWIFCVAKPDFLHMFGLVSRFLQRTHQSWRQLGINEEAHRLGRFHDCVIHLGSGELQAGLNVFRFKVGKVCQNFRFRHPGRQHLEYIFDTNAHAANAGPTATLLGIKGDSFQIAHEGSLAQIPEANKS